MKKSLILMFSCCIITACNSYTEKIKEEIKEEIINELKSSEEVQKGYGNYFYNEQVSIGGEGYYIHHSTLECPAIKGGVKRNFTYTNSEDRNLFCSKCMDDALIEHFNKSFFSEKKK